MAVRKSSKKSEEPPSYAEQLKLVEGLSEDLNKYALAQAYVLRAVTGVGYLALTWSSVVLLGGFVTSLEWKDFWCLTGITMVQAARIFHEMEDNLFPEFYHACTRSFQYIAYAVGNVSGHVRCAMPRNDEACRLLGLMSLARRSVVIIFGIIATVCGIILAAALILIIAVLYWSGPGICVVLSVWRIWQRDYGKKAELMPAALDLFYSLVLSQGALYWLWCFITYAGKWFFNSPCSAKIPQTWFDKALEGYFIETRNRCWKKPKSIKGRTLISYSVALLGSESQEDYVLGLRMLEAFIKMGANVRSLILTSTPKVQKLIDTLGWRRSQGEMRELAAKIVAYLASDIHLTKFPAAARCISSLLDTTELYCNSNQHDGNPEQVLHHQSIVSTMRQNVHLYVTMQGHSEKDVDGCNGPILQGLRILEKLAYDPDNCRDICSGNNNNNNNLLSKIMAPLYSFTMRQDVNSRAWKAIVDGSLKVVYRLICAPGTAGAELGAEISSSQQALENLNYMLCHSDIGLQIRAIKILTKLASDPSIKLNREIEEYLIEKQLHIFLGDDVSVKETCESLRKNEMLRIVAGETLALLLPKKENMAMFMPVAQLDNIVDRLGGIIDAEKSIAYQTAASEILMNLCTHCTLNKEHIKTTLLPKVLVIVLTPSKAHHRNISASIDDEENKEAYSEVDDDEENQLSRHKSEIMPSHEEDEDVKELQEVSLSLTLLICTKQIGTDDFNHVVQSVAPAEGGFVAKLKAIVDKNCEATASCLRIVKLCAQIVMSMLSHNQYTDYQVDQCTAMFSRCTEFTKSVAKASEIMSNLESCMLFAGTDPGVKANVRPLLTDLVEDLKKLSAN